MMKSPQRRTILFTYKTEYPADWKKPPVRRIVSLAPEMVGQQLGWVRILSSEVQKRGNVTFGKVQCVQCGTEKWINLDNLARGMTNGCQPCSQPRQTPIWLTDRVTAMRQRCTNPNDRWFSNYGARGIEFRFPSVLAACLYIQETLGLHKHLELDRIDNNGHYEAGNLRYASRKVNSNNRRRSTILLFHELREKHPEVRYADATLRKLLSKGLTVEQVIERWHQPSCKPKGVYGTFSTPDLDIVSLCRDGSCPTATSR